MDQALWQREETATDCIVPSPSFLSREPHLSAPGGMASLEGRVSGGAGDKRLEIRIRMRAPQINVQSPNRESGIKEENVGRNVMESGCYVSWRVVCVFLWQQCQGCQLYRQSRHTSRPLQTVYFMSSDTRLVDAMIPLPQMPSQCLRSDWRGFKQHIKRQTQFSFSSLFVL